MDLLIDIHAIKNKKVEILANVMNSFYSSGNYEDVLHQISKKQGYGDSHRSIAFWESLDEYDKSFYKDEVKGVIVEYLDEEVIIDNNIFYKYLSMASDNYIKLCPNKTAEIKQLLSEIKNIFS